MVKALKTALLLAFLASCRAPDKKPEIPANPAEIKDTVMAAEKDGVAVEPPVLTQTEEMPPLLVKQLDQDFPGWKIPEFSEKWLANSDQEKPNQVWIKGDFDKNRQEDFAVQILFRDSISVIAFLQQPRKDTFIPQLLERGPLSGNEEFPSGSFFYIALLPAGESVYNGGLNRYQTLPTDAVELHFGYQTKIFYFKAGSLKTLEISRPKPIFEPRFGK